MKRSISLILAILLLVTLTACQAATTTAGTSGAAGTTAASAAATTAAAWKRDANLNEPGTFPICKQTVKLTIGMPQNAMVENFETNWQTQQLEKKGNFDLSFTMFAATEIEQKIDLMIVAGGSDLPDVIMNGLGGQANLVKYGKAGMIVATNDYYTHSAYWIKQSLAKIDLDVFKYVTSYDGKIYGLFALMQSLNNEYSTSRLNIYEPWLKALGLEMPDTTAEFVDVLRAFKTKDPNKNGKSDEIPLIGSKDVMTSNYASFMMTPFIYAQAPNFWTVANGKIGVAYNTEAWREGLRYTKQLLAENLLSPLSFTQDKAQMTATLSTDPASVGTFVGVSTSLLGAKDTKRTEYVIVPPLAGPSKKAEAVWSPSLPSIKMVITKNCKTPEAAFMLGDLLCSEEFSVISRWGEKGVDWKVPAADAKSVYDSLGYKAIIEPITSWGTLQNKWWAQEGVFLVDYSYPCGQVSAASPYDHNIPIGRTIGPVVAATNKNPVVGIIYNETEQADITELQTTILTYVKESYTRFAMGDLSLDKDWDTYVNELKKMGVDKIIAATQSAYTRMNSK